MEILSEQIEASGVTKTFMDLMLAVDTANHSQYTGLINFQKRDRSNNIDSTIAAIGAYSPTTANVQGEGELRFYTAPTATASPLIRMTIDQNGNVTITGTLTVNGNQTGAADHVFDDYDDIELLRKWRKGESLPFETGDMLNRDRLLRDTIIQLAERVHALEELVIQLTSQKR